MEDVPAGPHAEALRARMAELMLAHREEVAERGPVFGLAGPDLQPRMVASSDGTSVTLAYGDLTSAAGPLVHVRTARPHLLGSLEASVGDQLADERDRLFDHAGIDEPAPPAADRTAGELHLDGTALAAEVHREDPLWGARAAVAPELLVTVVARGVPPEDVRLTAVGDLAPFWRGRDEQLASLAAQHPHVPPEQLELPPARGLEAHRALVESVVRDTRESWLQDTAGTAARPRTRRTAGGRQRLWESAVRAQMQLTDQTRDTANEQVTALVNHVSALVLETDWFAQEELGAAAVEETLGYAVFDAAVASRPAQQAWLRSWRSRQASMAEEAVLARVTGPLPEQDAERIRRRLQVIRTLQGQWQAAWADWVGARGQTRR